MQIKTFDILLDSSLIEFQEQFSRESTAPILGLHEQSHDFECPHGVVVELRMPVVVAYVAYNGYQILAVPRFEKAATVTEQGCSVWW
jgi:hypothetical protein